MKEDWVPAGQSRQLQGRWYGIKVINAQPGAQWRFDGQGLWLPITALHGRRPPVNQKFWEWIEISAPSSGEVRVLLLDEPDERYEELAQLVSATDSSGRNQVVTPGADLIADVTNTNLSDPYVAGVLYSGMSKYQALKLWLLVTALNGGTTPSITLSANEEFDNSGTHYAGGGNLGNTGAVSSVNTTGLFMAVPGATSSGQVFAGRWGDYVRVLASISGTPTSYTYRARLWGLY